MSQVVTELVIDANTSGADQFSQAMDRASSSAQSGTSSVAGMTLAVAGVGVAMIAAVAGLRAFVDYVGTTNKQLVDIAENARAAGLSTREFQQTLFAARAAGVTEKDFIAGLDKIGADLTAASRGVTEFGKLFEANGLSIKDTNGQLITTKTALSEIANLMANATPQVQAGIARIVGLSKDWIPFLRDGADAIEQQKQKAAALGIVIDDGVIQKAKEFDREWKTAVAAWDLQFKASLGSILPALVQLAGIATTVLDKAGQIGSFFSRGLTPVDQHSSSDLQKDLDGLQAYRNELGSVNAELTQFQLFKLNNKAGALGLEAGDLATVDSAIAKVKELIKQKQELAAPTTRVIINGGTKLPDTGGDGNDQVDRAINTLRRHIETQIADARAVGEGAAALAKFRAEAAETAAVQANGGKETAAQTAAFASLKLEAAAVADNLARVKISNENSFNAKTAFLSQDDVAIATKLKDIYPNVTTALNSAEAAQMRFNTAARTLSSAIENELVTGLTAIADHEKSIGQGAADMGMAVVKAIEQMIIKIAIVTPLMQALQAAAGGIGLGSLGGAQGQITLGNAAGPGAFPNAQGNIFDGGNVIPFARGGIIDREQVVPMARMGEAGPEAIVPLRRGADGNLGVASGGGGSLPHITVNLIETPGGGGATTQKQNANGGIDIEVAIAQITAKSAATPGAPLNRVLTDQLGSRQRLVRR